MEDLLKPRFKVIADYPDSLFAVGEVLQLRHFPNNGNVWGYARCGIWDEAHLLKFPNIFSKMEWWEERDEKDMPEYVKRPSGEVGKVIEHFMDTVNICKTDIFEVPYERLYPATKSEYDNQNQK
jgi:hypothetical protein